MCIFLDSSKLTEARIFHRMGVIRGITTNPTIMLRDGVAGWPGIETSAKELARLIDPLPLSVEVMTNDPVRMRDEALAFSEWGRNVVVKITIHGPNGEMENLELVHELETVHGVRVNVTAMMSAQQALLAALAGATYVSLFGGRVNDMGYNVCGEIARLRKILSDAGLKAQIIIGSTREILNVVEWLEAGAHIVTVTPELLRGMLVHPYSKETVQMFLRDATAVERSGHTGLATT
jgi:transaldolase